MTTEEKNITICKFMGGRVVYEPLAKAYPEHMRINVYRPNKQGGYISSKYIDKTKSIEEQIDEVWLQEAESYGIAGKYHTSWDWLMPVVEKISKIILDLPTNATFADDIQEELKSFLIEANLEGVWQTLVKFIEWYNTPRTDYLIIFGDIAFDEEKDEAIVYGIVEQRTAKNLTQTEVQDMAERLMESQYHCDYLIPKLYKGAIIGYNQNKQS